MKHNSNHSQRRSSNFGGSRERDDSQEPICYSADCDHPLCMLFVFQMLKEELLVFRQTGCDVGRIAH
jgi:hypothetical protein